MVNSGEIPYTDVQLAGITSGAESLRTVASAVRDGTADIVTAWGKISGSYEGPSDEQLFAVMTPIGPQGTTFGDDLDTAAKALDTFVEEVTPIVAALKKYVARAAKLEKDIAAFQPVTTQTMDGPVTTTETWDQDETLNGENNDIINGVANRVVEYQAAERKCANAIRALNGLPALHSITGSGNDDLGYGYDELPMGTTLPWGTAESRNESCAEKTGMFLPHLVKGVVWDGVVVGFFGGLGTMIGFKDWKWSGDNFVEAWKGMAPLLGYDKEKDEWWSGDAFWSSLGDVGKGFVAWDKWAEDPGTALGETGWNIASTFIPILGIASKFGKLGTVASAVSKADKVVDALDIGAWASKGLTRVLPKLRDLKNVLAHGVGDLAGRFAGRLADFKVEFGDWMHRHHGELDGSAEADLATKRSEADASAREDVDAQANASGGDPSVDVPEPEPALVGGGSGETAVVHGGGNDSSTGTGSGHGTAAPTHGSGTSAGGDGQGAGTAGGSDAGTPDRGHQVDPTETFGKVPYGDGVANHAGPRGTHLTDDLTRPGADLPDGVRLIDHRGNAVDRHYGEARSDHGAFDPEFAAPGDPLYEPAPGRDGHVNPATEQLVTSSAGPDGFYGHHADGSPLTRAEYVERYVKPDGTLRYPGNDGAAKGTRIHFDDPTVFAQYYSTTIDRMGSDWGNYFAFPGTSFEQRGLPPTNLRDPYSVFELDTGALKEHGYSIEISRIDPAFAQPGGGLQIQVFGPDGSAVRARQLLQADPVSGAPAFMTRETFIR